MDHRYWMNEHMEINKMNERIERRHSLMEHVPLLGFYLVSLIVVFVLISV